MRQRDKITGYLGLSAVITLITALLVFGSLNDEFSFYHDFISKLGALGAQNSLGWNLIGFGLVGLLLFGFGLNYGLLLKDKLLAVLLSLFGVGFALTSIPMDMDESAAPVSKAHIVVVCLGLAFWLFGLSRMGYSQKLEKKVRNRANISAIFLITAMIGFVLEFWSMPMTHRLVFGVVFGWTAITSLELITGKKSVSQY